MNKSIDSDLVDEPDQLADVINNSISHSLGKVSFNLILIKIVLATFVLKKYVNFVYSLFIVESTLQNLSKILENYRLMEKLSDPIESE